MTVIAREDALRSALGEPSDLVKAKVSDRLNDLTRQFVERSPFLCLATSAADGTCDVSPRGDPPGFVSILDERTLLLPDRPGNRLADSFRNVLENPHVALLFLIPGVSDTFRVNGRAPDRRRPGAARAVRGRGEGAHARPADRGGRGVHALPEGVPALELWDPERYVDRAELPSAGALMRSVGADVEPEQYDAERAGRYARREGFY